jgi:acetyl-CoA carboxylase biotin carboxyl carrier protein
MRAAMDLTLTDFKTIVAVIEASGYTGLRLRIDGARLSVDGSGRPGAAPEGAAARSAAVEETTTDADMATDVETALPDHLAVVRAPMVGTFYRAPAPDAPPFCKVGEAVAADDIVCLIEVMKLFNSIPAGVDGTVVEIRPENETRVAFDQALVLIEPA